MGLIGGLMTNLVTCCDCQHYKKDEIGTGLGLGYCLKYEEYKAKKPSKRGLKLAYLALGNKPFWAGSPGGKFRKCQKFDTR